MRKPINISTCVTSPSNNFLRKQFTTIICDDGTIWNCISNEGDYKNIKWEQLPNIPQDTINHNENGLNIR